MSLEEVWVLRRNFVPLMGLTLGRKRNRPPVTTLPSFAYGWTVSTVERGLRSDDLRLNDVHITLPPELMGGEGHP